jgi:acyl-CoA thioesterase-2
MPDKKILFLEPHGPDTFVGESPMYPWGRIYGGLVVAQALKAAALTVDPAHSVHSLHSYFILGGDPNEPVRYEVDRLRNGKSFSTRQVVARQSGGAILNLSASFQKKEEGPDVQTPQLGDIAQPEDLETDRFITGRQTRTVSFDREPPRSVEWARFPLPLSDDPVDHACALAYLSDSNAMKAIRASHPIDVTDMQHHEMFMGASLDHSIWFHRPVQSNDWLLFDMRSLGLIGTRGVALGSVLNRKGVHVASIAQEGLLREKKKR